MIKITAILIWYGIFWFVTGENNPTEWHWVVKLLAVFAFIAIINHKPKKGLDL
jgi:hypothetical protein